MGSYVSTTLPVPRAGLNFIDGPDAPESRPLEAARVMKNLYPKGATVDVRGGLERFVTIAGGDPTRSLFTLPLKSGDRRLVAATDNKLWRIDTGTPSNITGSTTPTSDDWNGTVFSHRLFLCNGVNTPQVYNGSTVSDLTFTGPTLTTLINVSSFNERLFFVQKDSSSFWFGNVQAVGSSALSEYPLDYFLRLGGTLLFTGSYTNNSGQSSQNLCVCVSSEGEVLCFAGSSPASATTWQLVSRYYVGRPLGYGAFVDVENDTWIITESGIVPMSLLFNGGSSVALNSVGRSINPIIQSYAKTTGFSHLWRGLYWPAGKRVYIQVPRGGNATMLLVCNVETGAWTMYEYSTQNALSMAILGAKPYFGGTGGAVFLAEQNFADEDLPISFECELPFTFFGSRGQFKKFVDVRPLVKTASGVTLGMGIDTDFRRNATISTITTKVGTFTPWGAPWGSPWSSESEFLYDRYGLSGQGHSGALRIKGSTKNVPVEFSAFEIRMEVGGQV